MCPGPEQQVAQGATKGEIFSYSDCQARVYNPLVGLWEHLKRYTERKRRTDKDSTWLKEDISSLTMQTI